MMRQSNKMIVYQVLPRLFGNLNDKPKQDGSIVDNGVGKFSDFTSEALNKIHELGITHIWYTGVLEHATKTDHTVYQIRRDHSSIVKGNAGSPYAVKDYYDVDPDLANDVNDRMLEFEELIARTHAAGMKVIIDFVPNHVSRQYYSDSRQNYIEDLGERDDTSKAFAPNNNFYYLPDQILKMPTTCLEEDFEYSEFPAKATGNDRFDACPSKDDWYETIKLNYGVDYVHGHTKHFDPIPNTWEKMLEILLFWSYKGIDGFRCDMAEMVPVEFWNWVIPKVKHAHNVFFIAEVYNPDQYRNYIDNGHFDYLYDKVGLYDTLRLVITHKAPASSITRCWQAVEGIQNKMVNFLENHDEQRIASHFFAGDPEPGIPGMLVAALMNTNPVMIYSGQELGERAEEAEGFSGADGRTTIFDYWSVESVRNWINGGLFDGGKLSEQQKNLRLIYKKILNIAKEEPAISEGKFYDLTYANIDNPDFDSSRQYAFLRKYEQDVILVVANFDRNPRKVRINIPQSTFEFLEIEDNKACVMSDLIKGTTTISTLTAACPYEIMVEGLSGAVLKFSYQEKGD